MNKLIKDFLRDSIITEDSELDASQIINLSTVGYFRPIVTILKSLEHYASTYLTDMLKDEEIFKTLIKNNWIGWNDFKHLLAKITETLPQNLDAHINDLQALSQNIDLISQYINLFSFEKIVDVFKQHNALDFLFEDAEIYIRNLDTKALPKSAIQYALEAIDNWSDGLSYLFTNRVLLKYIFKENLLTKDLVNKFNESLSEMRKQVSAQYASNIDPPKIENMFDYIEHFHRSNQEYIKKLYKLDDKDCDELIDLMKVSRELYKLSEFDFTIEEKLEICEILSNNEIAQSKLQNIILHNLESSFNFESLKANLTKPERRDLFNI